MQNARPRKKMKPLQRLNIILSKANRRIPLSDEDIAFAKSKEESLDSVEAILSHQVTLYVGNREDRRTARRKLIAICEEGSFYSRPEAAWMLLLAFAQFFSTALLQTTKCIPEFAYCAAKSPSLAVRVNATQILNRLAKAGDSKAIEILKECRTDSDPYVRRNAEIGLKSI
jgi:HEAT repeat protein